jgi:hypothetical protein
MDAIINIKSKTENPNDSFESFIFFSFKEKTNVLDINDFNTYIYSEIDFGELDITHFINQKLPTRSHIKQGQFAFDINKDLMNIDFDIILSEKEVIEIQNLIENNKLR